MSTSIVETTKKRKSKTTCTEQETNEHALIAKSIEKIVREGGQLFEVHAKVRRFHSTHNVVVTRHGRIFFPDHGMCDLHAMVAEAELQNVHKLEGQDDACYSLALFLIRPKSTRLHNVPLGPGTWRKKVGDDGMTVEQRGWWSADAYAYITEVRKKREARSKYKVPSQDPVVRGIPFVNSVAKRINPIRTLLEERLKQKMTRVSIKLLDKSHAQLAAYHNF